LNVHFHLVVPDGVFVEDGDSLTFVMLPVPSNADVLRILDRIMRRVVRRHGALPLDLPVVVAAELEIS